MLKCTDLRRMVSNVSLMRYGNACQPAQLVLAVLLNNVLAPSLVLQSHLHILQRMLIGCTRILSGRLQNTRE